MQQLDLIRVTVSREINGLEMGVLSDGTSYLTARSLAKLCELAPASILDQGKNWREGKRDGRLARWLTEHGIDGDSLYVETEVSGTRVHAYPDDVCMLILEYYAFEARTSPTAQQKFRTLARAGLRLFVYSALGYDPSNAVPLPWRHFHDRMTLASAPIGYFSVFKETADFVIGAIRGGLRVDDHTVPDISLGRAWSTHWERNELDLKYGQRIKHDHNYPDYFPQAASNPQPIWVYPVEALAEFRVWVQREYVVSKFPAYLDAKVKKGMLPASVAQILVLQAASPEPSALVDSF